VSLRLVINRQQPCKLPRQASEDAPRSGLDQVWIGGMAGENHVHCYIVTGDDHLFHLDSKIRDCCTELMRVERRSLGSLWTARLASSVARALYQSGLARLIVPGGRRIGSRSRIPKRQRLRARRRKIGGGKGQSNTEVRHAYDAQNRDTK
jgi:hypothetical protein